MEIYWDKVPDGCEEILEKLVRRGLEYINAPDNAEVSISFVDRSEIQRLNLEYRGIDNSTDVLSFPFTEPAEWMQNSEYPIALGDVIICTDIAKEQALNFGHSTERELGFLVVHGLLHLAGYDHMNPEEDKEMRLAQRAILDFMPLEGLM